MRAVIQRVSKASVAVENEIISKINIGVLIFLGIEKADNKEDALWLANKIVNLRIFCFTLREANDLSLEPFIKINKYVQNLNKIQFLRTN